MNEQRLAQVCIAIVIALAGLFGLVYLLSMYATQIVFYVLPFLVLSVTFGFLLSIPQWINLRIKFLNQVRESGMTTEQFCWEKGLNKATISNFLRQKKDFRISTLLQIAEALGSILIVTCKADESVRNK